MEWVSILGTKHEAETVETFDSLIGALDRIDALHSVNQSARLGHRVTDKTLDSLGRIASASCDWFVIRKVSKAQGATVLTAVTVLPTMPQTVLPS